MSLWLPVVLSGVDAGHEFFGIFRGVFDHDTGSNCFRDPDVRVVRLDITGERFVNSGGVFLLTAVMQMETGHTNNGGKCYNRTIGK